MKLCTVGWKFISFLLYIVINPFITKQEAFPAKNILTAKCQSRKDLVMHTAWMQRLWACRDGMKLAERRGAVKLCIESELVQLWESRETRRPVIRPILREIQELTLAFYSEAPSSIRNLLDSDCNQNVWYKTALLLLRQAHFLTFKHALSETAPSSMLLPFAKNKNP